MSSTLKRNGQRNDEKIDRVFFLLQNQKGLLRPSRRNPDPNLDHARNEIEKVIAQWLTKDLRARSPFLDSLAAAKGNRDAVAKLLEVNLRQVMVPHLAQVAREDIDTNARTESVEIIVEREIKNWKALLPEIRRRPDGSKYVERGDAYAAQLWRSWGDDLEEWSSYIGASYYLVAACEMLVRRSQGRLRGEQGHHICRLIQRLREHPDWRVIDAHDVVTVVEEQIGLVRIVEETLVDLDLQPGEGSDQRRVEANDGKRVTYAQAITGLPSEGLQRTPQSTLHRWIRDPQKASDLGVNPKGKPAAQQPLLDGLLRLQAVRRHSSQPRGKRRS